MSLGIKSGITPIFIGVATIGTDLAANNFHPTGLTLAGAAIILGGIVTNNITQDNQEKANDANNRKILAKKIKHLPMGTRKEILTLMERERLQMRCHKTPKNRVLDTKQWGAIFTFADNKIAQYEHEALKHQSLE